MSTTPDAFTRNPSLDYNFYNNRRRELNNGTKPNLAHFKLVELEKTLKINIITQNIDNIHETAGSSSIIYIHGELNKVRCIKNDSHISTTGPMIWMKLINVLTVALKCALISVGSEKCPSPPNGRNSSKGETVCPLRLNWNIRRSVSSCRLCFHV